MIDSVLQHSRFIFYYISLCVSLSLSTCVCQCLVYFRVEVQLKARRNAQLYGQNCIPLNSLMPGTGTPKYACNRSKFSVNDVCRSLF